MINLIELEKEYPEYLAKKSRAILREYLQKSLVIQLDKHSVTKRT